MVVVVVVHAVVVVVFLFGPGALCGKADLCGFLLGRKKTHTLVFRDSKNGGSVLHSDSSWNRKRGTAKTQIASTKRGRGQLPL